MAKIVQTAGRNVLGEFAPQFAHFNDDVLFGENWNNQDIDVKTRSIITVVALMSQGITDSSLKFHLQNAKDHGVTQKEIDAKLEEEQLKNARTITVEGRPVQDKDEVVLDFEGFVDGEAFEGGKGENYPLTIGSGSFILGFEEQLIGAEPEKEVEVKVTFPEEYQAKELAGKEAVFQCDVKKVEAKELPELDDDFAQDASEFDTLAEYKEDIKKNLTEKKEKERTLEEAFLRLDEIIQKLEKKDTTLEDSFLGYQEGIDLIKFCNQQIDTVEKKILVLNEEGEADEF